MSWDTRTIAAGKDDMGLNGGPEWILQGAKKWLN